MARAYGAKQRKLKGVVDGADKIITSLKAMNSAAANVLMNAAKAGGKIALADAKKNCPEDNGRLKSSLKLAEDKKTKVKASVKVDYDKSIKYGTFVELGTHGKPGNPFLRNAVDDNEKKINEEIVRAISSAVSKEM